MIIKLSDWLISTVKLYPPNVKVASVMIGTVVYSHYVTLLYAERSSSENVITVVWKFESHRNEKLSSSTIVALHRMTGETLIDNINYPLKSDYTWGEVFLQETIKLIGAV